MIRYKQEITCNGDKYFHEIIRYSDFSCREYSIKTEISLRAAVDLITKKVAVLHGVFYNG